MKKYITYEEPFQGQSFTENQIKKIYKDMADKTEYPNYNTWIHDMLKSGVFEEIKGKIKIIYGSFLLGCGIVVHHEISDNFYHLIVLEDKESGRLFVEIKNKKYFVEDIEK